MGNQSHHACVMHAARCTQSYSLSLPEYGRPRPPNQPAGGRHPASGGSSYESERSPPRVQCHGAAGPHVILRGVQRQREERGHGITLLVCELHRLPLPPRRRRRRSTAATAGSGLLEAVRRASWPLCKHRQSSRGGCQGAWQEFVLWRVQRVGLQRTPGWGCLASQHYRGRSASCDRQGSCTSRPCSGVLAQQPCQAAQLTQPAVVRHSKTLKCAEQTRCTPAS